MWKSWVTCFFLDLGITDVDGIYEYEIYNKRDNYSFFIVRILDLSDNIPAYVFTGQFCLNFLE